MQDLLAGGDIAGERYHAYQRVRHQRRPTLSARRQMTPRGKISLPSSAAARLTEKLSATATK
jgi:hypothetical protein